MGLLDWALGRAMNQAEEADAIEEAAAAGLDVAYNMCGNDGQVSIIDMTAGAFWDAAETALDGGGAASVLRSGCPYPEAVGDILDEAGGVIEEIIGDFTGEGDPFDDGDEMEATAQDYGAPDVQYYDHVFPEYD